MTRQSIEHYNEAKPQILSAINACLESQLGIGTLIELVGSFEEDSKSFKIVKDVYENIRLAAVLTDEQRLAVIGRIKDLRLFPAKLLELAGTCMAIGVPPPVLGDPVEIYDYLSELNQQYDHPAELRIQVARPFPRPLLEFIERVASLDATSAAVRAELRGIVESAYDVNGFDRSTLGDARIRLKTAPTQPGRKLCFLVELKPEHAAGHPQKMKATEARYFVAVWVCEEDGTFLTDGPLGLPASEPETIAAIKSNPASAPETIAAIKSNPASAPETIAAIKSNFVDRLGLLVNQFMQKGDSLRIEILLPQSLRCEEFGQWAFANDPENRLGRFSEVVVRCRDRLSMGRYGNLPLQILEQYGPKTLREPPASIPIIPVTQAGDAENKTLRKAMEDSEGRFCLLVAAAPADFPDQRLYKRLLQDAVDEGMAVGLWVRQRDAAADAATELHELLSQADPLDRLPSIVLKLRKSNDAKNDAKHLGNHLTLFWDDPVRVPPSLNLAAPPGRGTA